MSAWVLVLIIWSSGMSAIKALDMPNKAACEIAQHQLSGEVSAAICVNRGVKE